MFYNRLTIEKDQLTITYFLTHLRGAIWFMWWSQLPYASAVKWISDASPVIYRPYCSTSIVIGDQTSVTMTWHGEARASRSGRQVGLPGDW